MNFYNKFKILILIFVNFLFACCKLEAEEKIRTNEPIIVFTLPHFGEDGLIDWDIQGDQGRYSPERIEVSKLVFRLFDNLQPPEPETIIKSPHAIILPEKQIAYSDDAIVINSERFHLTGKKWQWNGKAKKILVYKRVEVFFSQGMIDILK